MSYHIWAAPTANCAHVSTGASLPKEATYHRSAATSTVPLDMAAKIAKRHGSLDFPTLAEAESALAVQEAATLAGL